MSTCDRAEALRDYAFDELPAGDRHAMEQHIAACSDCTAEFDQLRVTTAALHILPEREIPRRIAFVSDKVFNPSPAARFFAGFWHSSARLGFASACILATGLIVFALHRPAIVQPAIPSAGISQQEVSRQIDAAVAQVRADDAKLTKAALDAAETRHDIEHRALMAAWKENLDIMQKRLGTYTTLASLDAPPNGAGQ